MLKVERALAIDKCTSQRMLRDSVHASLIEESRDLESLVFAENKLVSTTTAMTNIFGLKSLVFK
jgi:hypothetical protein